MLTRSGFAFLVLLASGGAAAAQSMCGEPPIAPVIPTAAEIRQKPAADAATVRHNAFLDIKRWQASLKSYRDCLSATINTDKRDLYEDARASKPDKDKMASIQQEMKASNDASDASANEEEKVVNDFHAAQVAYCTRTDVDVSTCPKN
ncbi:MAG TPA: hypothetical protein VG274_10250 [Rhizomicrobium sp.]|nr:hypothetical protein [Rhizomicrobium sp.]